MYVLNIVGRVVTIAVTITAMFLFVKTSWWRQILFESSDVSKYSGCMCIKFLDVQIKWLKDVFSRWETSFEGICVLCVFRVNPYLFFSNGKSQMESETKHCLMYTGISKFSVTIN